MTRLIACVIFAAGCVHARPVEYAGSVTVTSPELVAINPDVKTVADADQPLIFASGSYWLFHDGHWYGGRTIRGPWVQETEPPVPVAQIDQPYALVHYKKDHPTETAVEERPLPEPAPAPVIKPQPSPSLLQFPK